MRKYLLLVLGFCMMFIFSTVVGQNSVIVGAFQDINGDGVVNDGGFGVTGLTNTELILWEDVNNNGVADAGDTQYDPVENTTAYYTFDNAGAGLPDGNYILQYIETPWVDENSQVLAITLLNQGADVTADSDVDPLSGFSASFNVSGGVTEEDIDLGLYYVKSIGDFVWEDLNADGLQDGETANGLQGVEVRIELDNGNPVVDTDGNAVTTSLTTDANGNYLFGNLPPGEYIIQFVLPTIDGLDWFVTDYNSDWFTNDSDADPNNDLKTPVIELFSTGSILTHVEYVDAGFYSAGKVGDLVFCDANANGIFDGSESGLGGVEVVLYDATTTLPANDIYGNPYPQVISDGAGNYMFENVKPGSYRIGVKYTTDFSNPPFYVTEQDAGGDDNLDSDVDPVATIDGAGDESHVTDVFELESRSTDNEQKWDAGLFEAFMIAGNIWLDDNSDNTFDPAVEGGPGGILVNLYNGAGNKLDFIQTTNGEFTFPSNPNDPGLVLKPGSYYIEIDQSAFGDGAVLNGTSPCVGSNDAGDMVDNDDNGSDDIPAVTTTFTLESDCDPTTDNLVEYIDMCYFYDCNLENDLAFTACGNITESDIICDLNILDAWCNRMPTENSPDNDLNSFCDNGGIAHNISWFAFVAFEGSYDIIITPFGCTGSTTGTEGVQIGVYTDCSYTESVYCNPDCNLNPVTLNSSLLEPGQTYYFFIDGCSESVCSYDVDVIGSPTPPNLEPDDVCINDNGNVICTDDQTYCPGANVSFIAEGVDLTVDYTWSIITNSGTPYTGDGNPMTTENTLDLSFPDEGEYTVCVTNVTNGCHPWSGSYCRTVSIVAIQDEVFDPVFVCMEDLNTFDPSVLVDADAAIPTDPNGDGIIGWQGPTTGLVEGNNTHMVNDNGCMYDQQFELMTHPVSTKGDYYQVICDDELPITIDAITITDASFAGNLEFPLADFPLANVTDVNGCDTVVDILIERLDIFNGTVEVGPCLPEGILMNFTYNETLSTEEDYFTVTWMDPSGSVLADNFNPADPKNNVAPTGQSGTYTLSIDVTKEGTTCTFDYPVSIDLNMFLPSTPDIDTDMTTICGAGGAQTYSATNYGDAFVFNWTITGGGVITEGGTVNSDSVVVDWSGSNGGQVMLEVENGCGPSPEVSETITVVPIYTPAFDFTAEVCQDSIATISFTGDQSIIDSYMWDFNGGTINNGATPNSSGPFEIIWGAGSGPQTISLTVIHDGGCMSQPIMHDVKLVEPLTPPTVNCNPTTGEVSFTWSDVAGATGYDVLVTSTDNAGLPHSGTLTGTTYTVNGLDNGETVTIQLVVFTGDACMMVEGAAIACTSQDCVAPTITLDGHTQTFCLNATTGTTTITPTVTSGETGTGMFTGLGVDAISGVFDPALAGLGMHTITYTFTSNDNCIGQQNTLIEVKEQPVASFSVNRDVICITESIDLSYNGAPTGINDFIWTTDDGQTLSGASPTVSFTTPGVKIISLKVVKDGCESEEVTQMITVEPALEPINVNCTEQMLNEVTFSWDPIVGASGYNVTVTLADGTVQPPFNTTNTTHTESGLNPGDVINISVEVASAGRCLGDADDASCTATDCPTFAFTYPNEVIKVCADGTNAPIALEANATGGAGNGTYTWNGTNVTGSQFDPNGLAEGEYDMIVTYKEGDCEGSGMVKVMVTKAPVADFTIATDPICVGSSLPIVFTGSNFMGQSLDWSGSDVAVTPNLTTNDFIATFPDVGTFEVEVVVSNGDCPSDTKTEMIEVQPELIFGDIDCDQSLDQITFSWGVVDCATEYEVIIDGTSQGVQTETSYTASGLTDGQEVEIEVIAVSGCACGNVMKTKMCEAKPCVKVGLSLEAMGGQTDFCFTDNLATIEILSTEVDATPDGVGSWSGTGVDANGIFDPNAAGVGAHTITYTFIEPEGCEDFTEEITFNIFENPSVDAVADSIDCYSETVTTLNLTGTGGNGNYSYLVNGQMADAQSEIEAGDYIVVVTDENGCSNEVTGTVSVPQEPTPEITGSSFLFVGETSNYMIDPVIFTGVEIDSIVWTANGTIVCNSPTCFSLSNEAPTENTTYTVTVYYNDGCSVVKSYDVEVREVAPETKIIIPNAISPNNDGKNDTWKIFTNDPEVMVNSIRIYDRWGELIFGGDVTPFSPMTTVIEWDGTYGGKDLLPGVYVYFIEYVQRGRDRVRSGDVTIIR